MKPQNWVLLFETILCLLVVAGIYLINHYMFANTYRPGLVTGLLIGWVFSTFFSWKKELKKDGPKPRLFTYILIALTILIFAFTMPKLTYEQGKEILAQRGYDEISELEINTVYALRLPNNTLIPDAYLYAGKNNNIEYYIVLSPISGEMETEEMGTGNYLDKFFEMKSSQQ